MPTIRTLLQEAAYTLPGSETPQLDALILLEAACGRDRATLLADFPVQAGTIVSSTQIESFRAFVSRRARGEPIAYIIGRKEFYGLEFRVGPGVLIPRPDTEAIVQRGVELLGELTSPDEVNVFDCCTGTGCIGISMAVTYAKSRSGRERSSMHLILGDIDTDALAYCHTNVDTYQHELSPTVRISVLKTDLFNGLSMNESFDLITANPPYLTDEETTKALSAGWGEPPQALKAGIDGLEIIKKFIAEAFSRLRPGGYLLMEHGHSQGRAIREMCQTAGFSEICTGRDLADNDRYVEAKKAR